VDTTKGDGLRERNRKLRSLEPGNDYGTSRTKDHNNRPATGRVRHADSRRMDVSCTVLIVSLDVRGNMRYTP
jgi:hypothetical protein